MGLVKIKADIGVRAEDLKEVEFLVDSGSFYTLLPPGMAADMGITFPVISRVVLADSREAEIGLGVAYLRLLDMDREGGVLVGAMDVPMPLLGASALEALGLKVNPVDETLEHTRPLWTCGIVRSCYA